MTDGEFLQEILAHPEDDGPRLIYADWLEERGDPRGEFIRVQLALSQMSGDDPGRSKLALRERKLLKSHQSTWLNLTEGAVKKCEFRRGFIEHIETSIEGFLQHGDEILTRSPVRSARFLPLNDRTEAEPLLQSPLLGRLRRLAFRHAGYEGQERRRGFNDECVLALVQSPHLPALDRLEVPGNQLTDASLVALANCPSLTSLTHLDLSYNSFTAAGLGNLVTSPHLGRLHALILTRSIAETGAAEVLTQSSQPLRTLNMSSCNLGTRGLQALCKGKFSSLVDLDISGARIGSLGGKALVRAPFLCQLTTLRAGRNRLEDKGVLDLAASPRLEKLRTLDLRRNRLTGASAKAIADAPGLGALIELDLRDNRIDAEGVETLAQSQHLASLKRVDLRHNDFSADEAARLREKLGARFARLAPTRRYW